jgi:hypothetical protein
MWRSTASSLTSRGPNVVLKPKHWPRRRRKPRADGWPLLQAARQPRTCRKPTWRPLRALSTSNDLHAEGGLSGCLALTFADAATIHGATDSRPSCPGDGLRLRH